jgi:hypothetical protein
MMKLKTKIVDRLIGYQNRMQKWCERRFPKLLVSDRRYAEKRFFETFGRKLDLQNPVTLNEKLQWVKLYDRRPIMTDLTDKYLVRSYVKDKVGEQYLAPLYGVYESVDELIPHLSDFPDKYILKATHGCRWNVVVTDSSSPSENDLNNLRNWLSKNYYDAGREWCYKNIRPRIICEKLIEPVNPEFGLVEYRILCFHGEPVFVLVILDHFGERYRNFYDLSWRQVPIEIDYSGSGQLSVKLSKPRNLDLMIEMARKLCEGFSFVRVDMYSERKVLFGEMTFYPGCGFIIFNPEELDTIFGEYLNVP